MKFARHCRNILEDMRDSTSYSAMNCSAVISTLNLINHHRITLYELTSCKLLVNCQENCIIDHPADCMLLIPEIYASTNYNKQINTDLINFEAAATKSELVQGLTSLPNLVSQELHHFIAMMAKFLVIGTLLLIAFYYTLIGISLWLKLQVKDCVIRMRRSRRVEERQEEGVEI